MVIRGVWGGRVVWSGITTWGDRSKRRNDRFVFQNLVIIHVVVTPILTIISSNKIQILSDERCNNGKTCYDNSNIAHNKKDVLTYIICIIPTNK